LSANTSSSFLSANTAYLSQSNADTRYLSANTSYYTQSQVNSNFISATTSNSLVLSKSSGIGIKVDTSTPTFPWRDIIGQITPRLGGSAAPALASFRGTNVLEYTFAGTPTADKIDNITFHIPHDYVAGTDIYLHLHWGHNGTNITGSFVINWYFTYCKGHNQTGQTFTAEKNYTQTISGLSGTTHPQWRQYIDEFQLSVSTGDTTHLVTNDLEPDGLVIVSLTTTTIPTITGGATNLPFIFMADIHYQSTSIGTKQKSPNFYI